ncbi:MAG TPA: hypothetical protein VFU17_01110 [Candidatus Limnocylindrales bacterium]|nr:hypothetical protein [Candidatus Limnocylindrales bacterium]
MGRLSGRLWLDFDRLRRLDRWSDGVRVASALRELLGRHNRAVRTQLDRFRGREVPTSGDGSLAIFDGPRGPSSPRSPCVGAASPAVAGL